MVVDCIHCQTPNEMPPGSPGGKYKCHQCGAFLPATPPPTPPNGDTSAAVGLIGGAALGAAIGGPAGAIIGGLLGAIIGKESKGVG